MPHAQETENDIRRRFGTRVVVDLDTGCHVWVGAKSTGGYGLFNLGGRRVLAHRVAYGLLHGQMPSARQQVRHQCDNPPCVNAAHLLLGTALDNARDRDKRDRRVRPPTAGRKAQYTDIQRAIVHAYESGVPMSEICATCSFSRQRVLAIVRRHSTCRRPPGRQKTPEKIPRSLQRARAALARAVAEIYKPSKLRGKCAKW